MSIDLEKLKKHLKETPLEELQKEWDALNEWDSVGPTVSEFLKTMEAEGTYMISEDRVMM